MTIMDDEGTPTASLVLTPASINENGGANSGVSTVTATLSGASGAEVRLTVSAAPGAGTGAGDYTLSANTVLTIAAGATGSTGTVTIAAVDNAVDTANKTVTVSAVASGGGVANPGDQALTIVDDDARGLILSPSTIAVDEGSDSSYTVRLATQPTADTTVTVSGHSGSDLTLSSASLTFGTGNWHSAQTVMVSANEDVNFSDETVTLTHTASGADYGSATGTVVVNIGDNDTKPSAITLTVDTDSTQKGSQASLAEDAGATAVRVTATLGDERRFTTDQIVTIILGKDGDGAREGADYATVPDLRLTISAGAAGGSVSFTLTPTDDNVDEPDENINVDGTLTGITVTPAEIVLQDNDAPPVVTLVLSPSRIAENGGADNGISTVTATLNRPSAAEIILSVSAVPLSPAVEADFTQTGSRLAIAAGSQASTGIVTLAAIDNNMDVSDKQVIVSGSVSEGPGVADPNPVSLTIVDDDEVSALTLSIDTDLEKAGLQNIIREDSGGAVRVIATLEGSARFAIEKTVTVAVGKIGDSATEGVDYEEVEDLSLIIPAGQASGTADFTLVPIEDGVSEPKETISVDGTLAGVTVTPAKITLLNNGDPLVKAWVSRFGRTVAEQILDSIENRIGTTREAGFRGTVGGNALSFAEQVGHDDSAWERQQELSVRGSEDIDAVFRNNSGRVHEEAETPTGHEILLDSSFSYTSEGRGGTSTSFWGHAARSGFDGKEGKYDLDGEVTTGMLGVDWEGLRWSGGFVLSRSQGEGSYVHYEDNPSGSLDPTLTSIAPWVSFRANEQLILWGIAGYGEGDLTLRPGRGAAITTDMDWTMAAAGAQGDLIKARAADDIALKLKADGLWVRTRSEGTPSLKKAEGEVTRLRLGLEGSSTIQTSGSDLGGSGTLTPELEIGVRYDDGDAETGFGVEVGGALSWVAPGLGLDFSVQGRSLVLHEDGDFRDWGFAASLGYDRDPSSMRGASLSLSLELGGSSSGGVDAMFAEGGPASTEEAPEGERWETEVAYGFALPGGRYVGSPHFGYAQGGSSREYVLGWRAESTSRKEGGASFDFMAMRREDANTRPEHGFGFNVRFSW